MANDDYGLLLGLYRHCTGCVIIEEKKNSTIKQLMFFEDAYVLKETRIKTNFVWKMYIKERELTRDEIITIFAMCNLKRHLLNTYF